MTAASKYLDALDEAIVQLAERLRISAGASTPDIDYLEAALETLKLGRDYIARLENRMAVLEARFKQ